MQQRAIDFATEFRNVMEQGATHEALLEIVRQNKSAGATQRETYDALHELWLAYGFDNSEVETPMQNELGFVLEVVWYGQRGTWDTSLSSSA